jgi:transcriptional regulator with XRE-family HTH domain
MHTSAQSSDMLTTMTPTGGMARLGRLVRLERQRQNLRQEDLAAAAHCSRNTITALEAGRTESPKTLPDILGALGLNASDLLVDGPVAPGPPGSPPPLANLSDAQLGNEAMRLLAEMTARLAARPTAIAVPPPGAYGVLSAVDEQHDDHPETGQ